MITLLTPIALAGLGWLAIPILIHIFKPRKVRVIPFSSLRWLRASQHRFSRRVQWHQILLFLLALAKPVLSLLGGTGRSERFVIVDASGAMAYRPPEGKTPFESALRAARDLLAAGGADDRHTVLVTGDGARALAPLTRDPSRMAGELDALRPGNGREPPTRCLRLIPPLLAPRRDGSMVELYFITDNLAARWSGPDISAFLEQVDPPLRVHVLDVGPRRMRNAWIEEARWTRSRDARPPRVTVRVNAAGDLPENRTLRLSGLAGFPDQTQSVSPESGRPVEVSFDLPATLDPRDTIATLTLEPADGLPEDDRTWLDLDPLQHLEVLLIAPEKAPAANGRAGQHLRTALGALADHGGGFRLRSTSPGAAAPADIAAADIVFMAAVPRLPRDALEALRRRVASGGGLAVFLGPALDEDFYGRQLHTSAPGEVSLIPAPPGGLIGSRPDTAPTPVAGINGSHPLTASLKDPVFGDLDTVRFRAFYTFDQADDQPDVRVPFQIGDRAPAVLDHAVGEGRVLVFNTTPDDTWSDLPRKRSFVPLIDAALRHLAGGLLGNRLQVGHPVFIPLPAAQPEDMSVTAPDGRKLEPALRQIAGRPVLHLPEAEKPGIYKITGRSESGPFARRFVVAPAARGLDVNRMDPDILKAWWAPAEVEVVRAGAVGEGRTARVRRWSLDPLLVALAFLALAAETIVAALRCPRQHHRVLTRARILDAGFFGRSSGAADPATEGGGTP
jgi:hypothetical protein